MDARDRLIVALDTPELSKALAMANTLRGSAGMMKIGSTSYTAHGPDLVRSIQALGHSVFLDLKLFDIPNQVAGAVKVMAGMGISLITIHTLGGTAMMEAAMQAALEASEKHGVARPLLFGVTILTSLDDEWLEAIGMKGTAVTVPRLAKLAEDAGLDGVVASAHEVAAIKGACPALKTLVPGVRLEGSDNADQKRVATPETAIAAGADYIVVGRPITQAADPKRAAQDIIERMSRA